jgi:hypothetical protein
LKMDRQCNGDEKEENNKRTPVSSTNKTVLHDIAEILLHVALYFKSENLNYMYIPLRLLTVNELQLK